MNLTLGKSLLLASLILLTLLSCSTGSGPSNNEFSLKIQVEPPSAGSVSVSPESEDSLYVEDQLVNIRASANEKWRFFEWQFESGGSDTAISIDVTMSQSRNINAVFHQDVRFSNRKSIADLDNALDMAAGDFDGDGDLDIVAVSSNGKTAWYENNGENEFGSENVLISNTVLFNNSDDFRIKAADLNNDGFDDLVSSANNEGIYWFESNGMGFITHELCCQNGFDIDLGDFTGNSFTDILVSTQSDSLVYYQNQGNGEFSSAIVVDDRIGNAMSSSIADLNGDGSLDIISGELYIDGNPDEETRVAWYENNGDGTFGQEKIIDSSTTHYSVVKNADLNNDGLPEVIAFITSAGDFFYYENLGNGNFSDRNILAPNNPIELADLDSDNILEVVMSTPESLYYYQLTNNYEIDRTREFVIDNAAKSDIGASIPLVDLDGDKDIDILFPSKMENKIWWYENVSYEN